MQSENPQQGLVQVLRRESSSVGKSCKILGIWAFAAVAGATSCIFNIERKMQTK